MYRQIEKRKAKKCRKSEYVKKRQRKDTILEYLDRDVNRKSKKELGVKTNIKIKKEK